MSKNIIIAGSVILVAVSAFVGYSYFSKMVVLPVNTTSSTPVQTNTVIQVRPPAISPAGTTFDFTGKHVCIAAPDFCNKNEAYVVLDKEGARFSGHYVSPEEILKKSQLVYNWKFFGEGELTSSESQVFKFKNNEWNDRAKRQLNDYWLVFATVSYSVNGVRNTGAQMLLFYRNPLTDVFEVTNIPTMPGLVVVDSVAVGEQGQVDIVASGANGSKHKFVLIMGDKIGLNDGIPDLGHRFLHVSYADFPPNDYSSDEQALWGSYGWRKILSN